MKKIKAWAILNDYTDINGKKYPGLLGVYYFDCMYHMPDYHVLTTCLFRTRKMARTYRDRAIKGSRSLGNKFSVIPVTVAITKRRSK